MVEDVPTFSWANYDRAIMDFDAAIDSYSGHPQTYVDRGYAYYMKGKYNRALRRLQYRHWT